MNVAILVAIGYDPALTSDRVQVTRRALLETNRAPPGALVSDSDGPAAPYSRLIMLATYPAPNPLSMFTTVTFDAHEFSIPSSAAIPCKLAP